MKSRTGLVPSTPGVRMSFDSTNHRYVRSRAPPTRKKRPGWNDRFCATVDPNASRLTAAELAAKRVGMLSKHNILHRPKTEARRAETRRARSRGKASGKSKSKSKRAGKGKGKGTSKGTSKLQLVDEGDVEASAAVLDAATLALSAAVAGNDLSGGEPGELHMRMQTSSTGDHYLLGADDGDDDIGDIDDAGDAEGQLAAFERSHQQHQQGAELPGFDALGDALQALSAAADGDVGGDDGEGSGDSGTESDSGDDDSDAEEEGEGQQDSKIGQRGGGHQVGQLPSVDTLALCVDVSARLAARVQRTESRCASAEARIAQVVADQRDLRKALRESEQSREEMAQRLAAMEAAFVARSHQAQARPRHFPPPAAAAAARDAGANATHGYAEVSQAAAPPLAPTPATSLLDASPEEEAAALARAAAVAPTLASRWLELEAKAKAKARAVALGQKVESGLDDASAAAAGAINSKSKAKAKAKAKGKALCDRAPLHAANRCQGTADDWQAVSTLHA